MSPVICLTRTKLWYLLPANRKRKVKWRNCSWKIPTAVSVTVKITMINAASIPPRFSPIACQSWCFSGRELSAAEFYDVHPWFYTLTGPGGLFSTLTNVTIKILYPSNRHKLILWYVCRAQLQVVCHHLETAHISCRKYKINKTNQKNPSRRINIPSSLSTAAFTYCRSSLVLLSGRQHGWSCASSQMNERLPGSSTDTEDNKMIHLGDTVQTGLIVLGCVMPAALCCYRHLWKCTWQPLQPLLLFCPTKTVSQCYLFQMTVAKPISLADMVL